MAQSQGDWYSLLLAGGFSAVAGGILVAHGTPVTGYESSIYGATPVLGWSLFALALLVAVLGSLFWKSTPYRYVAVGLGSTTMTAIVMLPIIRGYRYFGQADSLTHLGWTKDIVGGALDPIGLFYPGIHVSAIALQSLMEIRLERALLIVVVVLFVSYILFVPLAVRALTDDPGLVVLGAISAWLLLPMNQIATVLLPHTNSLTLLFVPAVLFAMIVYLRRTEVDPLVGGYGSAIGVVLAVLGGGLLLFHPQHAMNVILLFLGVSAVQFVIRRRDTRHPIGQHRPFYVQTAIAVALFSAWVSTHSLFTRAVGSALRGLFAGHIGATSVVAQRGTSLADIGASLPEIFWKLFLVSAVFALVTVWFALSVWRGRLDVDPQIRGFLTYFAVGFVPLLGLFGLYFLGTPKMSFRQLGLLYVIITIVGAIAIGYAGQAMDRRIQAIGSTAVRTGIGVFLAASLVLTVLTVFPSPFIYAASPQVTDQQLTGYQTAFEHRAGVVPYTALGSRVDRYGDALLGTRGTAGIDYYGSGDGFVESGAFSSGSFAAGYPASPYYLTVTKYDIERQIVVYHELHYTRDGLDALETDSQVDLVQTNGGFDLYVIG